jgi:hypothetical protein
MGEIAHSIIDGEFDCYTGEYLGRGTGFPRFRRGGRIVAQHDEEQRSPGYYIGPVMETMTVRGVTIKEDRFALLRGYAQHIGKPEYSPTKTCMAIRSSPEERGKFSAWLTGHGYLKPGAKIKK